MPRHHVHTLSDGQSIRIRFKYSAKKSLIPRSVSRGTASISVPPFVSHHTLAQWLADNEPLLRHTLAQAPAAAASADTLPEWIWYQGVQTTLSVHSDSYVQIRPSEILLSDKEPAAQLTHLCRFLHERAREYLLPRLEHHARTIALIPAVTALSNTKTFWGVCRHIIGIRLNWRLISAPDYAADYICIHELCHLSHPDHSPQFWATVSRLTPHTQAVKTWLKAYGRELFFLGRT